ncbi:MAG: ATP-binding protein [Cyanobacteria bacterium P01_A01_bin.116]
MTNSTFENQPILLAARLGANEQALRQVLETQALVKVDAPTVEAVSEAIRTEASMVVLTEEVLTDEKLGKQLGDRLSQQPEWSDIPVLILLKECQRFGDCLALLGQTTHHRSVLLLELPLKRQIFAAIVRSCLQNRQRQYLLRDTLYQLQESNQTLQNFSYTAAHELRNPLGVVKSGYDLLARTPLEPKQQKLVDMGQRTAGRMNQLLGALLDYSKVQSHTREYGAVDMNTVVKDAIAGLEVLINNNRAEINTAPLPTVKGDHQLLVQLVGNLIKNAIIHNDSQIPKVTIAAGSTLTEQVSSKTEERLEETAPHTPEHTPEYPPEDVKRWTISISDNGPGIATDAQEQIFEMFSRAGKSRAEGNGIGLALCSRVAKQHGTTIGVRSTLGEGSTFYFDLASTDGLDKPT